MATNNSSTSVVVGGGDSSVSIGGDNPIAIIAGPCVIESKDHCLRHAEKIISIVKDVGLPLIFKASYDKANRTSKAGFRGIGMKEGLLVLQAVREEFKVPVITDVHQEADVAVVAEAVDILQIPAFYVDKQVF